MRTALVLSLVCSLGAPAAAQPTHGAAGATPDSVALSPLAFLVGEWEGTGWLQMGPQRQPARVRETARWAAGGAVLVIDGLGTSTEPGSEGRPVHQAFAVVSYDRAAGAVRFRAYRAGEEIVDTPTIEERRLVWRRPAPGGGQVRFTMSLTPAGEWHEVGEFSRDGASWTRFLEMTLRRVR